MDTLEAQLTPSQRVFQRTMEAAIRLADQLGGPARDFTVAAGAGTIFIYSHREDRGFPDAPDVFEGYQVEKRAMGEILASPAFPDPFRGPVEVTDLTPFVTVAVPDPVGVYDDGRHIDPDNPPMTDADLARLRPARETHPHLVEGYLRCKAGRETPPETAQGE